MPQAAGNGFSGNVSPTKKYGYSKRSWWQELLGGDDPYSENDDPISRLFGRFGHSDDAQRQDIVNMLRNSNVGSQVEGLSDSELLAILDKGGYFEKEDNWWEWLTGENYTLDTAQLFQDLQELSNAPVRPDAEVLRQEAVDAINAENQTMYDRYDEQEALLDELKANRTASYEQSLADTRADYDTARTGLMSQQYQNNARLMDTMQSQMSKAQRNALEAGASAGLRIAGNVNALLSAQNKQSQQSLETSNQLAQMLLNQRAAERGLRNDYDNYMSQDAARRASIDQGRNDVLTSTQGRVNDRWSSEYSAKKTAYGENVTDWKSAYGENPFADSYFNNKNKSKYTGGA